jgi:hypothetical protein
MHWGVRVRHAAVLFAKAELSTSKDALPASTATGVYSGQGSWNLMDLEFFFTLIFILFLY